MAVAFGVRVFFENEIVGSSLLTDDLKYDRSLKVYDMNVPATRLGRLVFCVDPPMFERLMSIELVAKIKDVGWFIIDRWILHGHVQRLGMFTKKYTLDVRPLDNWKMEITVITWEQPSSCRFSLFSRNNHVLLPMKPIK